MSSSCSRTLPASGFRSPAIMLNRVVLPAPFGPITAQISPSPTSKLMESTASRPPNRFVSCSTRSVGSVISRSVPPRAICLQQARECTAYAAWREQRDTQHQQSERQDLIVRSHTEELRRDAQ